MEKHEQLAGHLVIDHCSPATIGPVLDRGFHAGVTLSSGKTSLEELIEILSSYPEHLDRIMLNTDSGSVFHENLTEYITSEATSPEILKKTAGSNAKRFFNLGDKKEL